MIEKLRKLGFSEYESKVYLALLKYGASTGAEICKKSKVPHGKTYSTLIRLEEKGLITVTPVKPKLFSALKPKQAFKRWLNEKTHDITSTGGSVLDELTSIKEYKPEKQVEELVSFIQGRDALFNLNIVQFEQAKHEILIISVGERIPFTLLRADKDAIERGVNIRFVATKYGRENKHILKEFSDIGIKVRHYKMQGFAMVIVDRKESEVALRTSEYPKDKQLVGVYFKSPDLAKLHAEYFESVWRKAKPVNRL